MNTWKEIVDKQTKEYGDHLEAVKKSKEQLEASKQAVLSTAKCSEAELPTVLKEMLHLNEQNWDKEYGMYGTRFKEMRINHQKELTKFFEREALAQEINNDQSAEKDKSKDKSAGR
ncbi:hypothetical protein A3860_33735 [Niastella vici]|uniref:Uncharacterized protein n=1 Tax=Niastella vici TaxID=1703345 RepID=A0A1V9FPQ4_9BACT|nr:hypothetical protein [Niastella vici]OQP60343.1 hypothetical protein A3860_33735 [Niastella vici]